MALPRGPSLALAGKWLQLLILDGLIGRYFISRLFPELPLQSPSSFPAVTGFCYQSDSSLIKPLMLELQWCSRPDHRKGGHGEKNNHLFWFGVGGTELAGGVCKPTIPVTWGQLQSALLTYFASVFELVKKTEKPPSPPWYLVLFVPLTFTEDAVCSCVFLCVFIAPPASLFFCAIGTSALSLASRNCPLLK